MTLLEIIGILCTIKSFILMIQNSIREKKINLEDVNPYQYLYLVNKIFSLKIQIIKRIITQY